MTVYHESVEPEVYELMYQELWHHVETQYEQPEYDVLRDYLPRLADVVADYTPVPVDDITPTFFEADPQHDALHPNSFPWPSLRHDLETIFSTLSE
jgi:hypothetical protein